MKVFSIFGRGLLIVVSACLALACSKMAASSSLQGPQGTQVSSATPMPAAPAFPVATPAAPTPAPVQNPENDMPRISAQEAKKLVDAGKAVIVDVRGTEAYKISHVKGALDYPLAKIESKDFSGLPKNKRIIAYCT